MKKILIVSGISFLLGLVLTIVGSEETRIMIYIGIGLICFSFAAAVFAFLIKNLKSYRRWL